MLKNYDNFTHILEHVDNGKTYDTPDVSDEELKELKERAWRKFRRAVMTIDNKHGFFADLLYTMKILMTTEVKTMATDGTHILWNPFFVLEELDSNEMIFVIAHELMHCILLHMSRVGSRVPYTWNLAGDYAINLLLDTGDDGSSIGDRPKSALFDHKYDNMSTEKIYELLPKQNNPDDNTPEPQPAKVGDYIRLKDGGIFGKITKVNSDGTYDYDIVTDDEIEKKFGK